MTALLMTGVFYLPLAIAAVFWMGRPQDRPTLLLIVLVGWAAFALLVAWLNTQIRFGLGGDDSNYFAFSQMMRWSWRDLLDLNRFVGQLEQPGYALLLSLLATVAGDSLLALKYSNLLFFIITALAWHRIGCVLETPAFGRRVLTAVLLTTPLWLYVCFLLKDMTIIMLQSLFMLGLIEGLRRKSLWPWLLAGIATLVIALFRVPLVAQNAGVAITALMVASFGRSRANGGILPLIAAVVVFTGLIAIVSNPSIMGMLGMSTANRVLGSEEMGATVDRLRAGASVNPVAFPIIYLLTEAAGLNPDTWRQIRDAGIAGTAVTEMRAMLSLPWIFMAPPFIIWGALNLLRVPPSIRPGNTLEYVRSTRLISTPWAAIALYVLSSMVISWTVGDTTRWRAADLPALAMIAVAGWHFAPRQLRMLVLLGWIMLLSFGEVAYYLVLK